MSNEMIEKIIERGLFASRWLLAPFYIGLAIALIALLYNFSLDLWHFFYEINNLSQNQVILGILSLIDLSLVGNLMIIVMFSGYENFVSQFELDGYKDQPTWTVDFATLKLKLISSMVAISGIHLLKIFMSGNFDKERFKLLILTQLVFVVSGVLLACMDFISTKTKHEKQK